MYIIVVGAGRIGAHLVGLALSDGHDVAVLEKDPDRCADISKRYDVIAFNADATREEHLHEARVEEADGIIASTRQDPVNLMVVKLAHRLGVPRRVAILNNPDTASLFQPHEALLVPNPSQVAAEHLLHAARHAGVGEYVPIAGDAELFKVDVEADSPIDGKPLRHAGFPPGVVVAAIERGGEFVIPRGDTRVHAGDVITLLAREALVDEVIARFRWEDPKRGA